MKYTLPLLTFLLLGMATLRAEDQTRNVQMMLKNEGFYYGDIDGKSGSELSAAVRRYQIRNGLEVTGALNPETLGALGIGGAKPAPHPTPQNSTPPAAPVTKAPPAPPDSQLAPPPVEQKPRAPINLRRGDDADSQPAGGFRAPDETMPPRPRRDPGAIPPPAPLDERNPIAPEPESRGGGGFGQIFAGTPYASAPRVVQESTVRRAQQIFAARGFYRDTIDGRPSPAMEEAVLSYQRSAHLPLSGRLDLQTLSILRLLPGAGRPSGVPLKPFNGPEGDGVPVPSRPGPVYRGVWVQ
jgi:peptidoglycan hydrolase-like protein with peptidoglycan-binding domain